MVLLEQGSTEALLPQDVLSRRTLQQHVRDERRRDGLVLLPRRRRRCSFSSSTSMDARLYRSGNPGPEHRLPNRRCTARPHGWIRRHLQLGCGLASSGCINLHSDIMCGDHRDSRISLLKMRDSKGNARPWLCSICSQQNDMSCISCEVRGVLVDLSLYFNDAN